MSSWFKVSEGEEHWVNLRSVDYITATRNGQGGYDVTFWVYGAENPAELFYELDLEQMARLRSVLGEK